MLTVSFTGPRDGCAGELPPGRRGGNRNGYVHVSRQRRVLAQQCALAGIHNESGIKKQKLPPARQLITEMLSYITDTSDSDRAFLPFKHDGKDQVVLMVNNLGGISELEMGLISQEALGVLDAQGIEVVRVNVGSFMVRNFVFPLLQLADHRVRPQTSCNLPGFSLTLLLLPRAEDQPRYSAERILQLLDAPASAPGWKPFERVVKEADAYVKDSAKVEEIRNSGKKVSCKSDGMMLPNLPLLMIVMPQSRLSRRSGPPSEAHARTSFKQNPK